ncbi:hypothetical protein S83_047411 [Arachis hypogaea]
MSLPPPPPFMSLPLLPSLSPSLRGLKHSERDFRADAVALTEEIWKASERESLEASIKAVFEAIISRGTNSHVVPSHCASYGYFLTCFYHFNDSKLQSHQVEKKILQQNLT